MPDMRELLKEQIKKLEEGLRLIEERMSEYVTAQEIPLTLVKEKRRIEEEIERKKAQLASLEAASTPEPGPDPLTIAQRVKDIHVDREEELALFREMIEGRSKLHVLFIEAESGMGKSALLREFLGMVEEVRLPHARVDFRNPSLNTFGEIFGELCDQLRQVTFSNFDAQTRNFIAGAGLTVGGATLLSSFVDAAMARRPLEDRQTERQMLIDVFFWDLAAFYERRQRPVIIMFDTFEKANTDVQAWMSEQFISRVRRYPWLICVIAGQETPRIDSDVDWCLHSTLQPLPDKHVREYLQKFKLVQSEDLITFITQHSEGHPSALQQLAMTLARMEQRP